MSEWGFVRVEEKNVVEPFWPGPFRPAGAVGKQADRAHCLFCSTAYSAKVELVRAHVAGVSGVGVSRCKGVERRTAEGDASLAERVAAFATAKDVMVLKLKELKEEKEKKGVRSAAANNTGPNATSTEEKRKLEEATSGKTAAKKPRMSIPTWMDKKSDKEAEAQVAADEQLALAFMLAGIPPNVLDNKEVKEALKLVALVGHKYTPPSRRTVGIKLVKVHRKRTQLAILAKQERCRRGGYSVTSDGAQNKKSQPIVVVVKVQGGQSELLTAINASGQFKDAEWTANLICDEIMKQPVPGDCVAVVQDNATRASWAIIEARCPWVTCCACWAHVLDLLLKDIGKLPEVAKYFREASKLRMFLKNKQSVLSVLRGFSPTLAITNPGATRFRSTWIGLRNIIKLEAPIRQTMVDAKVTAYVKKNKSQKTKAREGEDKDEKETLHTRFKTLQTQVLSEEWWEGAQAIEQLLRPIAILQAMVDGNAAMASKVYYDMYLVHAEVEKNKGNLPPALIKKVLKLITERWDYGLSDLNLAGYVLDPEYWDTDTSEESTAGFMRMVNKTFLLPTKPAAGATAEQTAAYKLLCGKQARCILSTPPRPRSRFLHRRRNGARPSRSWRSTSLGATACSTPPRAPTTPPRCPCTTSG